MTASHLASGTLAEEVKKKVRERALVVWLDAEGQYGDFVGELANGAFGFSYPVVPYRGSFLELMLALERYGSGLVPDHVLVHMPGRNKDSVKETPLYELAAAGTMFEKNLGSLVREASVGMAKPDEIDAFVREPGLTLSSADAWLAKRTAQPVDGLPLLLETLGTEDAIMALLAGDRRFDGYLPTGAESFLSFLEKGLGLDLSWRRFRLGEAALVEHMKQTEYLFESGGLLSMGQASSARSGRRTSSSSTPSSRAPSSTASKPRRDASSEASSKPSSIASWKK